MSNFSQPCPKLKNASNSSSFHTKFQLTAVETSFSLRFRHFHLIWSFIYATQAPIATRDFFTSVADDNANVFFARCFAITLAPVSIDWIIALITSEKNDTKWCREFVVVFNYIDFFFNLFTFICFFFDPALEYFLWTR